jgi:GntR family transcriptional regulator/MocR family aminotransferase
MCRRVAAAPGGVIGQFRKIRWSSRGERESPFAIIVKAGWFGGTSLLSRWEFALALDRSGGGPLHRQIAGAIAAEIERGRLRPGERLPGSRTLARTLSVHRQTVVAALEELAAEGWLVSRRASGTFVADGIPEGPRSQLPWSKTRPAVPRRLAMTLATPPAAELPAAVSPRVILMSGSRPDVRLLPADLIGRAYRRALRAYGPGLLSYGDPAGLPRLRRGLSSMLSATRGLAVEPDAILLTRGSQMGLALTARALVRPGDAVAVEHPGYRPAWEAFRLAGAEILPVPVDEHGLDVGALRKLAAERAIRALYVTPHHQFPTTVTLAAARRSELLRLAGQAGFAIIEDDYDHEFHYSGRPLLPLASADTTGTVIYVGTLSKVLAPALRLGFVVAPPDLIERLVAYRSFLDLQGDPVLECALSELLDEGLIQRHVRKVRRIYRARRDALASALGARLGAFLSFDMPSGGTAIWGTTGDERITARWCAEASRLGVVFEPGTAFTLDGGPCAGARFGFACLREEEIETAVERLLAASRS